MFYIFSYAFLPIASVGFQRMWEKVASLLNAESVVLIVITLASYKCSFLLLPLWTEVLLWTEVQL